MFFGKTRDLLVETVTIVKGIDATVTDHIKNEDKRFDDLHTAVEECRDSCSEASHIETQNGTLGRMEKKYDQFYVEHKEIKKAVQDMKATKKTRKEIISETLKYVTIACVVIGAILGYMRYVDTKKQDNAKVEKMLEELLNK